MRLGRGPSGKETRHLSDWHCGSIKAVTRSTFVSELQAAISATGSALMLGLTPHEIREGPMSPRKGMHGCYDDFIRSLCGPCEAACREILVLPPSVAQGVGPVRRSQ